MAHQTVSYPTESQLLQQCPPQHVEPDAACPIERTLSVLRRRWASLVVLELLHGPRSFGALAQALRPVSDKVLTERLAELAEAGVLDRRREPRWPPRVSYALTEQGRTLSTVLRALWAWGAGSPGSPAPPPQHGDA